MDVTGAMALVVLQKEGVLTGMAPSANWILKERKIKKMTILNEYLHYYSTPRFGWSAYSWIGIGVILLAGLITFFVINWDYISEEAGAFCCVLLLLFGVGFTFIRTPTKTPVTRYEVTVNDTISAKEFNDRYKIISQRGDILVIEERNKENETMG